MVPFSLDFSKLFTSPTINGHLQKYYVLVSPYQWTKWTNQLKGQNSVKNHQGEQVICLLSEVWTDSRKEWKTRLEEESTQITFNNENRPLNSHVCQVKKHKTSWWSPTKNMSKAFSKFSDWSNKWPEAQVSQAPQSACANTLLTALTHKPMTNYVIIHWLHQLLRICNSIAGLIL